MKEISEAEALEDWHLGHDKDWEDSSETRGGNMEEYERVREEIAKELCRLDGNTWAKQYHHYYCLRAKAILSLKGIHIEADDQSLPTIATYQRWEDREAIRDYREEIKKAGFVKCLPKNEEH